MLGSVFDDESLGLRLLTALSGGKMNQMGGFVQLRTDGFGQTEDLWGCQAFLI